MYQAAVKSSKQTEKIYECMRVTVYFLWTTTPCSFQDTALITEIDSMSPELALMGGEQEGNSKEQRNS